MASFFDVLADSDDEMPKVKASAPVAAQAKKAPVGSAPKKAGKGRTTGFTKNQNENAVAKPRRSERPRGGGQGGAKGPRGPRTGGRGREFDRRSGTGRGFQEPKGHSEAADVLAQQLEAEAAGGAVAEEGAEAAAPAEPEPEDSYVSLDAFMKKVSAEKTTSELAGELAPRSAEAEAVSGKQHRKEAAPTEDYIATMLGSGVAAKKNKGGKAKAATLDSALLKFKSPEEARPPRRFDDDRKGGFKGGRGGPKGGRAAGGAAKGGSRQKAPKAADFPTLGGK